jgi:hypothetical protein
VEACGRAPDGGLLNGAGSGGGDSEPKLGSSDDSAYSSGAGRVDKGGGGGLNLVGLRRRNGPAGELRMGLGGTSLPSAVGGAPAADAATGSAKADPASSAKVTDFLRRLVLGDDGEDVLGDRRLLGASPSSSSRDSSMAASAPRW